MFIIFDAHIRISMARRARDISLATSTLYLPFKGNRSAPFQFPVPWVDEGSVRETTESINDEVRRRRGGE